MDTLTDCGFVAIWNDVSRGADSDFVAWHAEEHMPERLAISGFLRGMRWGGEVAEPRYFTLYILSGPEIARSPAYLARLNDPTPWTRRVQGTFRNNSRCVGSFGASYGAMPGSEVLIVRLDGDVAVTPVQSIMAIEGVSGCHLGLADSATSALPIAERQGREVAEPHGLLIVCLNPSAQKPVVARAVENLLPKEAAPMVTVLCLQLDRSSPQ